MGPELPPSDISHSAFLKNRISETIFLKPVTEDEIKKHYHLVLKQVKHVDMMASRLLISFKIHDWFPCRTSYLSY